jgi:hypothetical protein
MGKLIGVSKGRLPVYSGGWLLFHNPHLNFFRLAGICRGKLSD